MNPRLPAYASAALLAIGLAGCDSSSPTATVAKPPPATTTNQTTPLPGAGKPPVTIGDKNYTEQFVLGQLYYQSLQAQGFSVQLNQNIGPLQVTLQALTHGQLGMYPEYLDTWNADVAGYKRKYRTARSAYVAGNRYALTHGLELLNPTPFSDTSAIGVTDIFAEQNHLRAIGDLRRVEQTLTIGGPPQFQQQSTGLPALEDAYGVTPAGFKSLEIGAQYKALDQDVVQAADVNTTDAELTTGNYTLLADPAGVFGIGNVVPVVSSQVLDQEGPAFADTINRVTALLTLPVIRQLNAAVDLAGLDPATAARRFLVDHGLVPPSSSVS
ncbi:MAG TPA: glycine betaine ABC transporter substrate-binding protein [Solirubrobacteraceae bacterium]|nr:glycine betaine ABC transporter substrate-binding protein [Solirubrobacteraceae bacterium]